MAEQTKPKMGRTSWTPPPTEQVEALAATGLTDEQIMNVLGISRNTFYKKKSNTVTLMTL